MQQLPIAFSRRITRRLPALMIAAMSACSDSTTAPATANVSISMATSAASATAAGGATLAAPLAGNGHTLTLAGLGLTIGDLRLEHSGHVGEDDQGVGSDDVLFAAGPTTVALPVDGGLVTLSSKAVPAGSFSQIEAELATLHTTGSYDDAAFDVVVELSHDMRLTLNPPLTVSGGTALNITVAIDLTSCFRDGSGTPVDPRTLLSGSNVARQAFRECVAGKLRAFEDRNREGRENR